MVWEGDQFYSLAPALVTLIGQLEAAYPDPEWQNSPDTGTIGDAAHINEGSASDHNPWLNGTVRALDVAKTANGPDCEALFQMVNAMYAKQDPRVWPNGYAIFNGRITDWDNPGWFHAQTGDQHYNHCHISVSQTVAGYSSTASWPIGESPSSQPANPLGGFLSDLTPAEQREVLAAARAFNTRLAPFDKLLYAVTNAKGYIQQALTALLRKG